MLQRDLCHQFPKLKKEIKEAFDPRTLNILRYLEKHKLEPTEIVLYWWQEKLLHDVELGSIIYPSYETLELIKYLIVGGKPSELVLVFGFEILKYDVEKITFNYNVYTLEDVNRVIELKYMIDPPDDIYIPKMFTIYNNKTRYEVRTKDTKIIYNDYSIDFIVDPFPVFEVSEGFVCHELMFDIKGDPVKHVCRKLLDKFTELYSGRLPAIAFMNETAEEGEELCVFLRHDSDNVVIGALVDNSMLISSDIRFYIKVKINIEQLSKIISYINRVPTEVGKLIHLLAWVANM